LDVDLQLSTPRVRVPDLVIMDKAAAHRGGLAQARDVLVAIEIVSPGSVDLDRKIKPMEYADAGIPHFWLIDPRRPVVAVISNLIEGNYEESQRADRRFRVSAPCDLAVDLDALLPS